MAQDSNAIVVMSEDQEWAAIVDSIVEDLGPSDLPDRVVKATEMLLAGYPTYQAAERAGVTTATVRRWLTKYPKMAVAVSRGRDLLTKWRLAKLDQSFVSAVERNQEILDLSLSGSVGTDPYTGEIVKVNPKILTVVAAQARYNIGLHVGQKSDLKVTHELGETVLNAKKDALDYLAGELSEQDDNSDVEPVEATYRVLDPKLDNQGPVVGTDDEPFYGEMGELEQNDEGAYRCHICGEWFRSLMSHVNRTHAMVAGEYETLFLLEPGILWSNEKRGYKSNEDREPSET